MTEQEQYEQRKTAIHLRRSGIAVGEIAEQLERSVSWVYKWWGRYQAEGWQGLRSRSRAPKHSPNQLSVSVKQAICQARSELEAEAAEGTGLHYIGAGAVRGRLQAKKVAPLPSTASIERVLHKAKMTHPRQKQAEEKVDYPHLQPTLPGQLSQVDIVPHYLQGGQAIACFNAIDVVSRYPTGQAYERRRSLEASRFLVHVWQTIGLSQYTQVDNEGCFSGGFTHPGVLGKVVRLALYVGTELVFSPVHHPESNGFVERFHQDYNDHVWLHTRLLDRNQVQQQADRFFADYRLSPHHSALAGYCPTELHDQPALLKLAPDFQLPQGKLPLTEGKVHFMRLVNPDRTVSVLNLTWSVPKAVPNQGVWVTLKLLPSGATLRVYDKAPDAQLRHCLAHHPFPLKEPVQPFNNSQLRSFSPTNLLVDLISGTVLRFDQVRAFISTMF